MARNLIQPLGSTHNFNQSRWLILFIPESSFRAAQTGEICQTLPFSQDFFVQYRHLTVFSSIAAAASHHHEGSSLIYGPLASISLRPRVPCWIWIRWIQYATHRNKFTSPPKLAMSTVIQNSALTPSYFLTGQHFLETFTLLLETTRTTNSRWLQRFSLQTANTTFTTLWRTYLPHTSNNALTFRSGI